MKTELVKSPSERVDKIGRRWVQDHEKVFDKALKKYETEEELNMDIYTN